MTDTPAPDTPAPDTPAPADALFAYAVDRLLAMEGGLAEHPADPGGITNFGISLRYAQGAPPGLLDMNGDGVVDARDIRQMTREAAVAVYRADWWEALRLAELPPAVAVQMLDSAVNIGRRQAVRELQGACILHGEPLVVDGLLGPKTRAAAGRIGDALLPTLKAQVGGFYRMLVAKRPQFGVFAAGWSNRVAHPVEWPPAGASASAGRAKAKG